MMRRLFAAGSVALLAGATGASADPIPAEDFSKAPSVSSVSMSLEGDMLVGVIADPTQDGDMRAAAYWDLTGNIDPSKPLLPSNVTPTSGKTLFYGATALKDKKSLWFTVQPYIGALYGCGEGRDTGATKKYLQKVYMGNEKIKKIDDLPDGRAEIGANKDTLRCFELVGETNIESLLPLDPTKIVISRASTKNGTSFFEHDLANSREKFLFKASDTESVLISNRDGSQIALTKLEYEDGAWRQYFSLIDQNSGEMTTEAPLTTEIANRYTMEVDGRQNGTGKYYIVTDKFSDKSAVYLYDPSTDSFSDQPLVAHPEYNVSGLVYSHRPQDFNEILGFSYAGPVSSTYWIDPDFRAIQDGLESAFKDKYVSIVDYNNDLSRVLFQVQAADMPPAWYLLLDKTKVVVIGSLRPWIDQNSLGKGEFVHYPARDGMSIPGFVTFPAGWKEGDKAKGAIIVPHGGPWARDSGGWDDSGWTQYFASRGYIVLQPQYRGSDGWGRELWLAGDGEWGQKMQDDKDDGAAWLVSQGYVDADKIAIHGYSYGGFAAIAASVRPNSPYRCAIAGAGVSNLAKLGNEWGDNRIQRIVQGNTVKGMDPMQNTDKVNIPIMLYHGDYDVRVPIFHSREFYNAIKKREPQSEFLVMEKMGHQSVKWPPENKKKVLEEIERFLNTTCGM
ncbi:alpha/beta hydrolase family protein [Hyphomonas jannaschiana]|uniref:S9 family peptidase n=1 Tax=Hyphomonas jannaschiana VP2 TaxID=1280952 RepID=A0A059FGJ7_9PROT|nr:prolyl oligopeptidase family serine peptidase [Hyphomonas jannaschiana]KCZ89613.1 S9 family peptidase [Hyphomonas jannaschiana VP2]